MFASKDTLLTRPSGYNIARSVRMRSSASAYLGRTFGTATNNLKWTWSAWVKRGALGANIGLLGASTDGFSTNWFEFYFGTNDTLKFDQRASSTANVNATTTAVFRDPSAWYHIVFVYDSPNATANNRTTLYVNGVLQALTYSVGPFAQNTASQINGSGYVAGMSLGAVGYFDGEMTEINFIDGQALTPSSFGETDSITGVWKPKAYSGTYGTNGFELNFSDNSNNTATTIGKDYSGNGNNWTPNNISVTAGATYDSMTDVPTLTSATAANYPVLNPLSPFHTYVNITNGNLTATGNGSGNTDTVCTTFGSPSTSIYWEYTCVTVYSGGSYGRTGVITTYPTATGQTPGEIASLGGFGWRADGYLSQNGSNTGGLVPSFTTGDVLGFALNIASGTCALYKNNSLQYTVTGLSTTATYFPATAEYNGSVGAFNFGQQGFKYTPPTGFVALNTYNLPASTIKNGAAYMAATTYTGTGASLTVANTVGSTSFQPDFVWVKGRSGATDHALYDSVRGTTKDLVSNSTAAETTQATGLTAFGSTGFTVGALAKMNTNTATYVGWQWKAGGTSASNTNGTITSTVSVGATQGFSVATYTGNGSAGATFGHGLGVAPSFVIIKERGNVNGWLCYHISTGNTGYLELDATLSFQTLSTFLNNTTPSSSVVTLGTVANVNRNGGTFVAYCFAAVAGYSAFGSYTGNGSADGPFVYTGFRPRFVMWKRTDTTGDWVIQDTTRGPYNQTPNYLIANTSGAEGAPPLLDINSNGFKIRINDVGTNASGGTYIYMAFAENSFKNSLAR